MQITTKFNLHLHLSLPSSLNFFPFPLLLLHPAIIFGGQLYANPNCGSIPKSQFNVSCDAMHLDTDSCLGTGEFDPTTLTCICFTSCPVISTNTSSSLAELEQLRLSAQSAAQSDLNAYNTLVTRSFTGQLTASALGIDPVVLTALLAANDTKQLLLGTLVTALAQAWNVTENNVKITTLQMIPAANLQFQISGTVTAPVSSLIESGQTPSSVINGVATISITDGASLSRLQLLIKSSVVATYANVLQETSSSALVGGCL
jgi:hypothetical protein